MRHLILLAFCLPHSLWAFNTCHEYLRYGRALSQILRYETTVYFSISDRNYQIIAPQLVLARIHLLQNTVAVPGQNAINQSLKIHDIPLRVEITLDAYKNHIFGLREAEVTPRSYIESIAQGVLRISILKHDVLDHLPGFIVLAKRKEYQEFRGLLNEALLAADHISSTATREMLHQLALEIDKVTQTLSHLQYTRSTDQIRVDEEIGFLILRMHEIINGPKMEVGLL